MMTKLMWWSSCYVTSALGKFIWALSYVYLACCCGQWQWRLHTSFQNNALLVPRIHCYSRLFQIRTILFCIAQLCIPINVTAVKDTAFLTFIVLVYVWHVLLVRTNKDVISLYSITVTLHLFQLGWLHNQIYIKYVTCMYENRINNQY